MLPAINYILFYKGESGGYWCLCTKRFANCYNGVSSKNLLRSLDCLAPLTDQVYEIWPNLCYCVRQNHVLP